MLHNDPFHGGLQLRYFKKSDDEMTTTYAQSPAAMELLRMLSPTLARMGAAGQYGGIIPEGMTYQPRTFSGIDPWTGEAIWQEGAEEPLAPGTLWGIPDASRIMPTMETFEGISPEVKAGVMAPYKEIEKQLLETLGAGGGLGSARGGFSGQGATGVGKYWGDVAPEYTKSLWGMTEPALRSEWEHEIYARQFPFQAIPGMAGAAMPTPIIEPGGGGKK